MSEINVENDVECIVRISKAEFVVVEMIAGVLDGDRDLICVETGRRYEIAGSGLGGGPRVDDKERHVLMLAARDGSMAENPLSPGLHLVQRASEKWLGPPEPTADDVLMAEAVAVRSKITILRSTAGVDACRLGCSVLFLYDGTKLKHGWGWLASVRVLLCALSEMNAKIPVFAIEYAYLVEPPDVDSLLDGFAKRPRGRGETIWFRNGAVHARMQAFAESDVEDIKRLAEEVLHS